jgi:MYXO-CTERM domain-containing protein
MDDKTPRPPAWTWWLLAAILVAIALLRLATRGTL